MAITRLNLEAILTKYSIVLKDCGYKMDECSCKQLKKKQQNKLATLFKCYWIIRQYIIEDCQRQYTGRLDLKVIVEV